jgi:hypothetical protein
MFAVRSRPSAPKTVARLATRKCMIRLRGILVDGAPMPKLGCGNPHPHLRCLSHQADMNLIHRKLEYQLLAFMHYDFIAIPDAELPRAAEP